jgi:hypothetical protein
VSGARRTGKEMGANDPGLILSRVYFPGIFVEELRKTKKKSYKIDLSAEISTGDLPNTQSTASCRHVLLCLETRTAGKQGNTSTRTQLLFLFISGDIFVLRAESYVATFSKMGRSITKLFRGAVHFGG